MPDFTQAQRKLLRARPSLQAIADHLELDWRTDWSLGSALDSRGAGSAREQVSGALALFDKLERLRLRPDKPGRKPREDYAERFALIAVRQAFKASDAVLKVGAADSPGIAVVSAVLRAITGRRSTPGAVYKRIRRQSGARTRK